MKGQLSRRVPARTEIVRFPWVVKDFSFFTEAWRAVRSRMRNPLNACWWCKGKFADGDQIALASREKDGNVVLCQTCADRALAADGVEPNDETRG